jgi:thiol-disulfide isomerase/thioredoxin
MDRRTSQSVAQESVPFTAHSLAGTTLRSTEWKGRVIVLSFWAMRFLPCHAELPAIEKVQNRYRENPNVVILALDSGTGGDTPEIAKAYLNNKKLSLTGAIDSVDAHGDIWNPLQQASGSRAYGALHLGSVRKAANDAPLGTTPRSVSLKYFWKEIDRLL